MTGGFRRNWSPRDVPPQGRDLLRHQHRPWTESRGVELIAVTAGQRHRGKRSDGGLVPRWGQRKGEGEERGQ